MLGPSVTDRLWTAFSVVLRARPLSSGCTKECLVADLIEWTDGVERAGLERGYYNETICCELPRYGQEDDDNKQQWWLVFAFRNFDSVEAQSPNKNQARHCKDD